MMMVVTFYRVEMADKSTRMEAFFFGHTGTSFVRNQLQLGSYWEISRFSIRKLPFAVFQLTMNMAHVTQFKRLPRAPASCSVIAKSPDDEKKLYGKGFLMSAHRLYLNRACTECKRDIKDTLCENQECRRCDYRPPMYDKLRSYKATLAVSMSENGEASSWMRKDSVKNVELMGKPWVLTPHLAKLFDPDLIHELLESGHGHGHMDKYNEEIKQALADMFDVWAGCVRNTGQTIEVSYTNRRYGSGALVNHLGGSRYLINLDIDYSKITEEDKANHGYHETVSNVKDLLTRLSVAKPAINSWEAALDSIEDVIDRIEEVIGDSDDDDEQAAPAGA